MPFAVCVLAFVARTATASEDCLEYGDYFHWCGSCGLENGAHFLAGAGSNLWVVQDEYFQTVDASVPDAPVYDGFLELPAPAEDMAVVGDMAFVGLGGDGLQFVSLLRPDSPRLGLLMENVGESEVVVGTTHPLVSIDRGDSLYVINWGDVEAPEVIGRMSLPYYAYDAEAGPGERFIYLASEDDGLVVIDLLDVTHPVVAGSLDGLGYVTALEVVAEHYVYLIDENSVLSIVDVAFPGTPVLVDQRQLAGDAVDLSSQGQNLYVTGYDPGLAIYDLSDPEDPLLVHTENVYDGFGVVRVGAHLYVASEGEGTLEVFAQPDASGAGAVSTYPLADCMDVVVYQRYATAIDSDDGAYVLDVLDPENPQLLGEIALPTDGTPWRLVTNGHQSFVAIGRTTGSPGEDIRVIDLDAVPDPAYIGGIEVPGEVFDLVAHGGYIFASMGSGGVHVIDATDVSALELVTTIPLGYSEVVTAEGDHVYASDLNDLVVVDVGSPESPSIAGSTDLGSHYLFSLTVEDGLVYGLTYDGWLLVVDVTDPAAPVGISETALFLDSGYDIVKQGSFVYAALDDHGVLVVDVSDPAEPIVVGSLPDVTALGLFTNGDLLFVADSASDGGLVIANLQCESTAAAESIPIRSRFQALRAHPNPFRAETTISYELDWAAPVRVEVLDVRGRRLATLFDGVQSPGRYELEWRGVTEAGAQAPNGVYLVRLTEGARRSESKVLRIR